MHNKYYFGQEGIEYIRAELSRYPEFEGIRTTIAKLPLEAGRLFGFLPVLPPADLIDEHGADVLRHSLFFYYGGVYEVDGSYRSDERGLISEWLCGGTRRVCLFQASYSRFPRHAQSFRLVDDERVFVCDPDIRDAGPEWLEGWIVISDDQADSGSIDLARARGMSPYPPTLGMLTEVSPALEARKQIQRLGRSDWEYLVAHARYLVFGAFDGEILLFWEPPTVWL